MRRGGHHRSLYIIPNFGPRCRTGSPPRLFRPSPRKSADGDRFTRLVRPPWPISPQVRLACRSPPQSRSIAGCAASITKFGCRQPNRRRPQAPERPRAGAAPESAAVAFALASAGIARGFLAQSTSRSSGQLCMPAQNTRESSPNRRKSCSNAEKTRKTVDWLVTLVSISPSRRPCAYAG